MYNYCANFVNLNTELKIDLLCQSQLLKGCEVYCRWSFLAEKMKKRAHLSDNMLIKEDL